MFFSGIGNISRTQKVLMVFNNILIRPYLSLYHWSWFSDIYLPAPVPFGVKKAAFWDMSAYALIPKCGGLSGAILKSLVIKK